MDLTEKNREHTRYDDAPGTRALTKGGVALALGILLGVLAFVLAAFGLVPALLLLVVALPLGRWGSKKLQQNQRQIGPRS